MRRGKCWEIRLEEERDTRINTLLSCIIPCAKLGWTLKGSTRVIARIRCCHFIYWRPDLHYSVNERVSTHLWDQTCDHLLDLCLIARNSLFVSLFNEMNSPIYVPNFTWKLQSSLCHRQLFLACYARETWHTRIMKIRRFVMCI